MAKKTILHCNNVCWLGGTMLATLDLAKAYPEFRHSIVYFQDGGENYDLIDKIASDGIDISYTPQLTKQLIKDIDPSIIVFNNTTDKHVEGEWPYQWLNGQNIIAIHHNPTHPLFDADLDIFVSGDVFRRYNNCISRIKKYKLIPPCINANAYSSQKRISNNKRCVIGKLSNDNAKKYPESLIEILKEVNNKTSNVGFTIVGGAKYYKNVDFKINMPAVGSQSPEKFYAGFDILVYKNCDDLPESWGRVITEAMASGLAIVAENRGGIKEQIDHGVNGLLCNSNAEFINYLVYLVNNPKIRYDLGMAAREKAIKEYDISRLRQDTINTILELT